MIIKLKSWWGKDGKVVNEYIDRAGHKAVEYIGADFTLSVSEVAQLMGVSRISVQKWISTGKLATVEMIQPTTRSKLVTQSSRRRGLRIQVKVLRQFAIEGGYFMAVEATEKPTRCAECGAVRKGAYCQECGDYPAVWDKKGLSAGGVL